MRTEVHANSGSKNGRSPDNWLNANAYILISSFWLSLKYKSSINILRCAKDVTILDAWYQEPKGFPNRNLSDKWYVGSGLLTGIVT